MSKNTFKKHVDLLLLEEKTKSTMYNHTLYRGRKNICGYFLKAFNTKKIY